MSIRDQERWKQVQELLLAAAERPKDERPAFLARACRGNADLAAEVGRLLALESQVERGIESAIEGGAALLVEPFGGSLRGQRFGAYRLIRELGRGGMGVVYLAERADDQFDKRVALKLIRPAAGSAGLTRRFRRERQILAGLEHPAIAQLLDGGTEDGAPFLVMEYVEGTPIDEYCRQQNLGLRQRLQLFSDVCAAVEHAHRNLVVHRDLKPANILVTAEGEVKLLDFGIAKLLETEGAAVMEPTLTTGLMTPQYASPEQVGGGSISTASDIYSLGLLLYELLAGERPYRLSGRPLSEVQRLVCEQDPEAPSATLDSYPGQAAGITPKRLTGDLDAIVMKALRKEPAQRYSSVERLSLDIDCYLEGRPVEARRGGWAYRAGKLARRHQMALAVAVAFIVLSAGFTAKVVEERDTSEQAVGLMIELIGLSEPSGERRRRMGAEEKDLDRRTDELVARLRNQPARQAALLDAMGRLYQQLDLNDRALPLLEQALGTRRTVGDSEGVVESLDHLAELLVELAKYEPAKELLLEAVTLHRQLGDEPPQLAESLTNLAHALVDEGSYEAAEDLYREALEVRQRTLGNRHPLVAESLSNLGLVLQDQEDHQGAEDLLRQALGLYRETLGEDDPDYAAALSNLGQLLSEMDRYDEAEEHLREAIELATELLGEHGDVALYLDNLARLLRVRGDFEAAEQLYRRALGMRRRIFGEIHPAYAQSLNNLARLLLRQNQSEEAEDHFRQALRIRRKIHGEEHREISLALNNLATAIKRQGNLTEAETLYRQAIAMSQSLDGDGHPSTASFKGNLGMLLFQQGDQEAAEPYLRQAIVVHRKTLGEQPSQAAKSMSQLGMLLTAKGELEEAEQLLREALEIQSKILKDQHVDLQATRRRLDELRSQRN